METTKKKKPKRIRESKLTTFMLTQFVNSEFWKWSEDELGVFDGKDVSEIGKAIYKRFYAYNERENPFEEFHIILHDKDTRKVWDTKEDKYIYENKLPHVHLVAKFLKGKGMTLRDIAIVAGVEPQYVEKQKRGKDSYNNMLSYLIHAKDSNKYQYEPSEVVTLLGEKYIDIYNENRVSWEKGRSKKTVERAKAGVDELETLILNGEVTKKQILLTDEFYEVYARESVRLDRAFNVYAERKVYKTIDKMDRGDFKLTVLFISGASRSGKSKFTDLLTERIIEDREDEKWEHMSTASSNPFDEYLGEEIIKMDDLRGLSLTASDWLKLMDPERVGVASARYKNKRVAPRVLIINSEKEPYEFFSYFKNGTGSLSEAMDQFFARILKLVKVFRVDEDSEESERVVTISSSKRVPSYTTKEKMKMNYRFSLDHPDNHVYSFKSAINELVNVVNSRNDLNGIKKENHVKLVGNLMYINGKRVLKRVVDDESTGEVVSLEYNLSDYVPKEKRKEIESGYEYFYTEVCNNCKNKRNALTVVKSYEGTTVSVDLCKKCEGKLIV